MLSTCHIDLSDKFTDHIIIMLYIHMSLKDIIPGTLFRAEEIRRVQSIKIITTHLFAFFLYRSYKVHFDFIRYKTKHGEAFTLSGFGSQCEKGTGKAITWYTRYDNKETKKAIN